MTNPETFLPKDPPPSYEPREEDPTVARIQAEMAKILPDYNVLDRSRWDGYNPGEDEINNGRLLRFFKGEKSSNTPEVMFIFKKEGGYAINVYRNPLGMDSQTRYAVNGGTLYKDYSYGDGSFWTMEDLPQSIEAARITMEGIPRIPEVIDQPTFVMSDNRIVTLKDFLEDLERYRQDYENKRAKKHRETHAQRIRREKDFIQTRLKFRPRNIYKLSEEDPQLVNRLVRERLAHQNTPFIMGGKEYNAEEILAEVEKGSEMGKRAELLEIIKIGTYLEILWENRIIL